MILMSVQFLCFALSATKCEINSIPTASSYNQLPLPSHPSHDFEKYNPHAVDSTKPKVIWCICFTDLSETAIKYPSSPCALSESLIIYAI